MPALAMALSLLLLPTAAPASERTVTGRWTSESLTSGLGLEDIGSIYLVGDSVYFWAKPKDGKEWLFFLAAPGNEPRVVFTDDKEFAEPDGLNKKVRASEALVPGGERSVRRLDRLYIGCSRPKLRKFFMCGVGEALLRKAQSASTVYVYEDGSLKRLLGPGDTWSEGAPPAEKVWIRAGSESAALLEIEREGVKGSVFVLARSGGFQSIVEESVPLLGHPGVQVASVQLALLDDDVLIAKLGVEGAPHKRALYRLRSGAPAEKLVAEGDAPAPGRPLSVIDRFFAENGTVGVFADRKGGPAVVLRYQDGALTSALELKPPTGFDVDEVVTRPGRPDVVMSVNPRKRKERPRLLHAAGAELRDVGLAAVPDTVWELFRKVENRGFTLKPSASGAGVHVLGPQMFRREGSHFVPEDAAGWYLDFDNPAEVVEGPVFATDDGPALLADAIDWSRPDEVLIATLPPRPAEIRRLRRHH